MIFEPATGEHRTIYEGQIVHNNPATFTGDGSGVITTIKDDEGNYSLFTIPLDGSQKIKQLNSGYYESNAPTVSPDGKWLLYYAKLVNERFPARDIRAINLTTDVDAPLYRTSNNQRFPRWSPDGSQLIFTSGKAETLFSFNIQVDTFNGHANHGAITGTVINATENAPYPDLRIVAHDGEKFVSSTKTDEDGSYRLMLLPGEYTVKAIQGQGMKSADEAVLTVSMGQESRANFTATPLRQQKDNM